LNFGQINNFKVYIAPPFETPVITGSPHLVEWFSDLTAIGNKWIKSSGKKDDAENSVSKYDGEWEIGPPSKIVSDGDYGLIVKSKARHHAIASKLAKTFEFDGKPYEVKYEDGQECGGGYIKLLTIGAEHKLAEFTDKTPYTIMFGPDKCGSTSKIHFIIRLKNPKNDIISEHHAKQSSKSLSGYFDDRKTHLYTLIVRPDETFSVLVDNSQIMSGNLLTDLEPSVTPPKMIDDETDKKPADWDDREKIEDKNAKKPDDWDENAPQEIEDDKANKPVDWLENEEPMVPDEAAEKPVDWDDEMDGIWEAPKIENPKCKGVSGCGPWKRPMIPNPAYKGKWKRPMVSNPDYKGKWKARQTENPYFFEPHPYSQLQSISAVGFELWTMSGNIIIDNIFVGNDESAASSFAKQTFTVKSSQVPLYESASSPSEGIVNKMISATEERPWLWAVYILSILIPVIIIAITCFGRKSRPSTSDYKKTDEAQADDDDDIPNLVGDDDDLEGTKEEIKVADEERSASRSRSTSRGRNGNAKVIYILIIYN
uniref:Calreticulin family protein n=1 Tax=Dracunculus medinensis TaxID=318479 RepID=A0A0N4UL59_DRAME